MAVLLVAIVLLGAGVVLGRAVGGWRGLGAVSALTAVSAGALALAGEQPAAALGLGFLALLVHGAAEPEQAGWCACRVPRGRGAACRTRVARRLTEDAAPRSAPPQSPRREASRT